MSFDDTIRDAIRAQVSTATVRPLDMGPADDRPYFAYQITDEIDPSPTHSGPSSLTVVTYDVLTICDTYADASDQSELVRSALKNYSGTSHGTAVLWTRYQARSDIEQATPEGKEKPVYVRSQTFKAMYRAA